MTPLKTEWTRHLPPEKREDFEKYIRNSSLLIDRLVDILRTRGVAISSKETSEETFDNPSWSHKEAYLLGRKAELKSILALLDFRTDPERKS